MTNAMISRPLAAILLTIVLGVGAAGALTATTPETIRLQLTKALDAPAASVEVSTSSALLTISRIDTPMNGGTHDARNQEAQRIATAISDSVMGLPASSKILSFNVDYVKRAGAKGHDVLVDRIEFRKDASGHFVLHVT